MEQATLPVELYRDIVDQIEDFNDLLPLLSVCSTLRKEAQRRLYRTINLEDNLHRATRRRLVSWWIDIPASIGPLIHLLDIKSWEDAFLPSFVPSLYDSLPNLKTLLVPDIEGGVFIPPPYVTFRLENFIFELSDIPEDAICQKLWSFLDHQSEIIELDLLLEYEHPLSPLFLPKLGIASVKPSFARRLLQDRPITHLFLYMAGLPQRPLPINDCPWLRSLSVDIFASLDIYAASFPKLEFLELTIPSMLDLKPFVERMPHLRTLRVVIDLSSEPDQNSSELVQPLFMASKSLETIHVANQRFWPSSGDRVLTWTRSSSSFVQTHWHPAAWKELEA